MFKFLKDKLKKAVKAFSSKVETEGEKHVIESTRIETPVEPIEEKEVLEEKKEAPKEEEPKDKKKEEIKEPLIIIEEGEPEEEVPEEKPEEKKEEGPQIIIEGEEEKEESKAESREVLEGIRRDELIKEVEEEEKEEPKFIIEEEEKEEPKEEKKEEKPAPKEEKKGFLTKIKDKISHKEEKKSLFRKIKEKIVTTTISGKKFEKIFWDLELAMLENNVALEVVEKIKEDLREKLVDNPIRREEVSSIIVNTLKKSIEGILSVKALDLESLSEKKKPFVICFVGVNGSGKTTTIAKVAKWFQGRHMTPVIAAGDTFRAAAIQQIEEHADKLGVKLIKHDYGSDAAAVAFDAIKHAESKNRDVVLIDTAGRLHSNKDLIDELKKVVKVAKPHLTIFVGESITGNDCIEQAKEFNDHIGIDGIILAKADVDEKGGAALSVSDVTKKPILFLGTGQRYNDLEKFSANKIIGSLGL